MIVLALFAGALAKEKAPVDKDVVFSAAVDQLQHENYLEAANAAWEFLQVSTTDDPRYDRGDHLHHNEKNNRAMAAQFDLALLDP